MAGKGKNDVILLKNDWVLFTHMIQFVSHWPCGLSRGSAAARLLAFQVRIPPWAWLSVSSDCCVLLGRGLCDGMIPFPEDPYRVYVQVIDCDQEL